MGLSITTEQPQANKIWLTLRGQLVDETAHQLDSEFDLMVDHDGMTIVLDLTNLDYIASAGLRSIFKIRRWIKATDGKLVLLNPSPQVKKVFETVKAVPVKSVFMSIEELDQYLNLVQSGAADTDPFQQVNSVSGRLTA